MLNNLLFNFSDLGIEQKLVFILFEYIAFALFLFSIIVLVFSGKRKSKLMKAFSSLIMLCAIGAAFSIFSAMDAFQKMNQTINIGGIHFPNNNHDLYQANYKSFLYVLAVCNLLAWLLIIGFTAVLIKEKYYNNKKTAVAALVSAVLELPLFVFLTHILVVKYMKKAQFDTEKFEADKQPSQPYSYNTDSNGYLGVETSQTENQNITNGYDKLAGQYNIPLGTSPEMDTPPVGLGINPVQGSGVFKYKTACLPNIPFKGVKKSEYYYGLKMDTANRAIAPIGQAIEMESRGGWKVHQIKVINTTIIRKKTLLEMLFGWIPVLGGLLFSGINETKSGRDFGLYVVVFKREI